MLGGLREPGTHVVHLVLAVSRTHPARKRRRDGPWDHHFTLLAWAGCMSLQACIHVPRLGHTSSGRKQQGNDPPGCGPWS